ncbi:lipid-A-disaccharide synthase [Aetokthonos hydrillicola Thurmond2011]|jgi:lipid-A-disaccharide synthase|uniref:Lipid-A-disaccharide synthase n=1 Tax=Aetokthonos hydrillicola Thurmond2011 TaxID=2712845 RepID=A0AAP5II30_9CYAN|nr:lipid-A-disaccharide synthase [Aetokthonos hydrillicola]MBO3457203.1 lipid-A-disaccharide synthase [Aetokthonos hydrillicola CCALA 1050]MBW4587554.1 lipid-A-disaccharide synthase [Aetokthonos hydrillicola CCALA 1050]MDR9900180.1 lipid-A-disaccharide synthase [Aetokthonos hydrillicola Thurmond2011]
MNNVDILILSNGPGEVTTWVRPVVQALRQKLGNVRSQVRISVVLSPCPNATGKEAAIAQSFPEVDRVQPPEYFWQFLLWGKTSENWDWRDRGVVVFLGGDQFFSVAIGKRLGYRTVVYAEWEARWHNLIDRFAVMKPQVAARVSQKYAHKFTVVGDLMLAATDNTKDVNPTQKPSQTNPVAELIGILPGSKAAKLMQGIPLNLATAEYIQAKRPQTKFVIPVAPTLDLQTLASFADPQKNRFVKTFGNASAKLITSEQPILKTDKGLSVELYTESPAYEILSQCSLCLTTVGANTAELGSLGVPMIVLLPTQQLDAMRSWDGIPGILANLPLVGSAFAKFINWLFLRRKRLLAWPNIWAQEMIVPELVGDLQPQDVASLALDFLDHPEKLNEIKRKLQNVRGEPGAALKIAQIVEEESRA